MLSKALYIKTRGLKNIFLVPTLSERVNILNKGLAPKFFCTKKSFLDYLVKLDKSSLEEESNKELNEEGLEEGGNFTENQNVQYASDSSDEFDFPEKIMQKEDIELETFPNEYEKERRKALLTQEITSNPEFFKAFPQMKEVREKLAFDDASLDRPDKRPSEKKDFFESLLHQHSHPIYRDLKKDEKSRAIDDRYRDAFTTRNGPKKYLSKLDKEMIHHEIDLKMQELEDTGLSREEIVMGKPYGLPLKEDKYFQFLKNNRVAREMLIRPYESLSAENIIDRALKQDIGIDPAKGMPEKISKFADSLRDNYAASIEKKPFGKKYNDDRLKSDMYNYRENYLDKLEMQYAHERLKPPTFLHPPLTKPMQRKKNVLKNIHKNDITWRNLPLLVRFLNEAGRILNRQQTRLPSRLQKRVARVVKHTRNLGFLPHSDFIKPTDKVPITSNMQMFYEDTVRVVDTNSGELKYANKTGEQDKFSYANFRTETMAKNEMLKLQESQKFKQTLQIESDGIPFFPNNEQKEYIMALNHLLRRQNKQGAVESPKEIENSDIDKIKEQIDKEQEKNEEASYTNIRKLIGEKVSINNAIEAFVFEKSYSIEDIKSTESLRLNTVDFVGDKSDFTKEITESIEKINETIKSTGVLDHLRMTDKEKEEYSNFNNSQTLNQRFESPKASRRENVSNYKYKHSLKMNN